MQSLSHEWFMWIDMDTIIEDVEFELPLASYANSSLVTWGNWTELIGKNDSRTDARHQILMTDLRQNHVTRRGMAPSVADINE
eukprot:scaffold228053_cov16-Prasinocladus_malaysianus.AAC.1